MQDGSRAIRLECFQFRQAKMVPWMERAVVEVVEMETDSKE